MFKDLVYDVPPSALERPMSWSRQEKRVATLAEFLTSRFPKTALDLGLSVKRPQEELPYVNDLKPAELRQIVISEIKESLGNISLNTGNQSISQARILREVTRGTTDGQETIARSRWALELIENAARDGRLKLVPELDPDAPLELPDFPY